MMAEIIAILKKKNVDEEDKQERGTNLKEECKYFENLNFR